MLKSSPKTDAGISTHTPLARCDSRDDIMMKDSEISTHTPLARCDI